MKSAERRSLERGRRQAPDRARIPSRAPTNRLPVPPPKKPWLVFGVDPGRSGAIALLGSPPGGFADGRVIDTKDPAALDRAVTELFASAAAFYDGDMPKVCRVYVEDVHSMPGEGHVGAFSFGVSKGVPVGWFESRAMRVSFVDPRTWQSHFFGDLLVGVSPRDRHEAIRREAIERWPEASLTRKVDEAVAAALFIADFGVRKKPW